MSGRPTLAVVIDRMERLAEQNETIVRRLDRLVEQSHETALARERAAATNDAEHLRFRERLDSHDGRIASLEKSVADIRITVAKSAVGGAGAGGAFVMLVQYLLQQAGLTP